MTDKERPGIMSSPMSEEQVKELERLIEEGDDAKIEAFVSACGKEFLVEQTRREFFAALVRDTVLCAHHCLHDPDQQARGMQLLCALSAYYEDKKLPPEIAKSFMAEVNAINLIRVKASCGGTA